MTIAGPEIQYIDNKTYLEAMERYVGQETVREVMLVWGPKSTGKTEGINIKCQKWRAEGRPVVRVDLKGFVGTTETFLASFYGQVLNAVSMNDEDYTLPPETVSLLLRLNDLSTREHIETVEASSFDKQTTRELNDLATQLFCHFSEYYSKVGLFHQRPNTSPFLDAQDASGAAALHAKRSLQDLLPNWRLGNQMFQVLSSPRVLPGLMIFLEMMAELAPHRTPLVIFTEIQNLARNEIGTEGHKMFETLFKSFEVRKQGGSRVPVIAEMSEFLFSELQSSIQTAGESFEPFMLGLCQEANVKDALVPAHLTGVQFEKLWNIVGGHQGSIFAVFKLLRFGSTFEEALAKVRQRAFAEISAVLRSEYIITETDRQNLSRLVAHAYASTFEDRVRLLAELRAREYVSIPTQTNILNDRASNESSYSWKMPLVRPQEHPSIVYFTMNSILFFDGMYIYPQNKLYQYALDEYLTLIDGQNLQAAEQIRSEESRSVPGP